MWEEFCFVEVKGSLILITCICQFSLCQDHHRGKEAHGGVLLKTKVQILKFKNLTKVWNSYKGFDF